MYPTNSCTSAILRPTLWVAVVGLLVGCPKKQPAETIRTEELAPGIGTAPAAAPDGDAVPGDVEPAPAPDRYSATVVRV